MPVAAPLDLARSLRFYQGVKLYNYWRSSSSYRVRLALHFKELPFEYVAVALNKGEQHERAHRDRNPLGTVPLLEVEHEGRVIEIAQSVAIVEYLEERYPQKPLFPRDVLARAAMRGMVELVNSGIQPFHNLSTLQFVQNELKADEKKFSTHFIRLGLEALEAFAARSAGRFLVGDAFTWADACLLPQLYGARRFGVETAPFATLHRIEALALTLDFVKRALPEAQSDAPKT